MRHNANMNTCKIDNVPLAPGRAVRGTYTLRYQRASRHGAASDVNATVQLRPHSTTPARAIPREDHREETARVGRNDASVSGESVSVSVSMSVSWNAAFIQRACWTATVLRVKSRTVARTTRGTASGVNAALQRRYTNSRFLAF